MPFTGKATFTGGANLPDIAEDLSDLVTLASPHETPLLDALGEPDRVARSTDHKWLDDVLISNRMTVTSVLSTTVFEVDDASWLRVGDQLMVFGGFERLQVTAVDVGNSQFTATRSYGNSSVATIATDTVLIKLGSAALEGEDAAATSLSARYSLENWTQIFSATCEVSGSDLAATSGMSRDELEYQKSQRLRELLRDLENSVINGYARGASQVGSTTARRTMRGLMHFLSPSAMSPGDPGLPATSGGLTEVLLNDAIRVVWERGNANVNLIVVNAQERRAMGGFTGSARHVYTADDASKALVSAYEHDFGVARVAVCRGMPAGNVLLLDSTQIDVLPLNGRSFHYAPLGRSGDRESGQLIGEYTLEVRNVNGHGVLSNFV